MTRLIIFLLICVLGCSGNKITTPTQQPTLTTKPLVVIENSPPRKDLPESWIEIKGDNWSYGLSPEFLSTKDYASDIRAQHISIDKEITVTYRIHLTELSIVEQFVEENFIKTLKRNDKKIIATAKNNTNPNFPILLVHSIYVSEHAINNGGELNKWFDASLDFFMQKNNQVYHFSCSGESQKLKENSHICFQIVDTFKANK